ncbi:MAG: M16 family metallopeptidase [Acidimicrobiales bacterium]
MIRTDGLAGGITLVTEAMGDVASACVGFWVGTGGRDEAPEAAGASHFLEHVLFKGTPTWSARAIAEAVDAVGGEMNAFTAREYTGFYVRLLAHDLDLGLDILCDIMSAPALRPEEVDAERQVILEEILMHADEPADLVHETSAAALFPGHPLGRDVLGTETSVGAMGVDDIRAFFDHHYRPANMVVSVAGRIDHDSVAEGLARRLAGRAGGERPVREPPGEDLGPLVVTSRPTEQAHLVVAVRGPARHDKLRFPLDVLNHVLGGGLSSRLFQEIREQRGLAYSVYSDRVAYDDAGVLSVYVGTAPAKVHEVLALVRDELDELVSDGVTEAELGVAKGYLRAQTLLALEDSGARMSRIGRSQLVHGEVLSVDELVARVEAVTLDDVLVAARQVLGGPRSLAVVGPFGEADFDPDMVG